MTSHDEHAVRATPDAGASDAAVAAIRSLIIVGA